jgi:hypothetical protein
MYNGIADNLRQPRPASETNNLERYFAAHPVQ